LPVGSGKGHAGASGGPGALPGGGGGVGGQVLSGGPELARLDQPLPDPLELAHDGSYLLLRKVAPATFIVIAENRVEQGVLLPPGAAPRGANSTRGQALTPAISSRARAPARRGPAKPPRGSGPPPSPGRATARGARSAPL